MEIKIDTNKPAWHSDFGNNIEFTREGYLSINMYDGHTLLNKEEARQLGEVLLKWSKTD